MKFSNLFNKEAWSNGLKGFGMKMMAARPEFLLFGGGFLMLGGTIYACMQTEKAKKAISEYKEDVKKVEEMWALPEGTASEGNEDGDGDSAGGKIELLPATIKQIKIEKGRQLTKIYLRLAYEMIKIYGIPAIAWFGGFGMIGKGHSDLRIANRNLAADIFAGGQLMQEYRKRVAEAVGEDNEKKIFMGTQEGMIDILEKDPETGEEYVVQKKADVFYAQPGSIFARNFNEETCDAFEIRNFWEDCLDKRVNEINMKLDVGVARAYNGLDILRILGFNENALGEGEEIDKLLLYGISGNARKVPDPEMRKLKVTKLRGYQKKWDVARDMFVYVPCMRLDFNFYPLEGKI